MALIVPKCIYCKEDIKKDEQALVIKSSNSNCGCQCVETLAKTLKQRNGDNIFLFERDGATVFGKIKDVVNNSVLILGPLSPDFPVLKGFCTCDGTQGNLEFSELVVSICEITEFGSLFHGGGVVPKIEPATKGWFKKWF
ncbi:hypothetical protein [Bacillus rhizoplanae]|uniref:hypothetical protein n=1 Tax=Bacillus rhizoplanae TaxID=2880966 RepID=UPI003D1E7748